MTNLQRMKSDMLTADRREMADKMVREDRIRNDKLTRDRRFKADKNMDENRLKNDEMTANRREMKDGNLSMALIVFLLVFLVLVVGVYLFFI